MCVCMCVYRRAYTLIHIDRLVCLYVNICTHVCMCVYIICRNGSPGNRSFICFFHEIILYIKKVLTLVNNLCMYWWHICTHYTYIYLWTICLFLCSNWQFWLNEMSVVPRHSLLLFHLIHVVFVAVVGTSVVRFFFFFFFWGNCEIADYLSPW